MNILQMEVQFASVGSFVLALRAAEVLLLQMNCFDV
jgi:hypothetical protein